MSHTGAPKRGEELVESASPSPTRISERAPAGSARAPERAGTSDRPSARPPRTRYSRPPRPPAPRVEGRSPGAAISDPPPPSEATIRLSLLPGDQRAAFEK